MQKKTKVKSSTIDSVSYENSDLIVFFKNGNVYSYSNVPEKIYEKLLEAESIGSYFSQHVRNRYDYYKHDDDEKKKK